MAVDCFAPRRAAAIGFVAVVLCCCCAIVPVGAGTPLNTWVSSAINVNPSSTATQATLTFDFATVTTFPAAVNSSAFVTYTVLQPADASTRVAWSTAQGNLTYNEAAAMFLVANAGYVGDLPTLALNASAGYAVFAGVAPAWVHLNCITAVTYSEFVYDQSTTRVRRSFTVAMDVTPVGNGTIGLVTDAVASRFSLVASRDATQSYADVVALGNSTAPCGNATAAAESTMAVQSGMSALNNFTGQTVQPGGASPISAVAGNIRLYHSAMQTLLQPSTFPGFPVPTNDNSSWSSGPLFWVGGTFNGSAVIASGSVGTAIGATSTSAPSPTLFAVGTVWAQDTNGTVLHGLVNQSNALLDFGALAANATASTRLYSACVVSNLTQMAGLVQLAATVTWPTTTAAPTTTTLAPTTTAAPTTTTTTAAPTTTTAAPTSPPPLTSTPAPFTVPLITTNAPATTTRTGEVPVRKAVVAVGDTIEVTNIYSSYDPSNVIVTINLVNDTWLPNLAIDRVKMTGGYPAYLQPHGFNGAMVDDLPSVYQYGITTSGAQMNITFLNNKCFFPSTDDTITVTFTNYSTVGGAAVAPVTFTMIARTDQMDSDNFSGLVVVSITAAALAFLFLLDAWCEVVITLTQLQCLAMLCLSTCAPPGVRAIFESCQWILWPISDRVQNTTSPETLSRLTSFLALIAGTLVVTLAAYGLFGCFSDSKTHPAERARFPSSFLFFLYVSFAGGVFASTLALIPAVTNDYSVSSSNIIAAVFTALVCVAAAIGAAVAVFRVVAALEFRDSAAIHIGNFWKRLFFGGAWINKDGAINRWGVIFENMCGSGFWYFGAHMFLVGVIAVTTAFSPDGGNSCSRQYGALVAMFATNTVFMFLRRPFKSVYLNFVNMGVAAMSSLIAIAFATSMTCSRKGMTFAYFAVWLGVVLIMFKSIATLVVVSIEQFISFFKEAESVQQQRIAASPKRRLVTADGKVRLETEAVELQLLSVLQGQRGLGNAAYKPSIPVPLSIGACIVCREVGFGGRGGLDGNSGPSVGLQLHQPTGLCMDGDHTMYVLDTGAHRILKHDLVARTLTTIAGGINADGTSNSDLVSLNQPRGCCVGQSCLFIADTNNDCIRRLDLASGTMHTVLGGGVGNTVLLRPHSVATIGNLLYVADTMKHRVIALHLTGNNASTVKPVMGTGYPGYNDITTMPVAAQLNSPQALTAYDESGELYIVDTGNHRVLRFSTITQQASLVIGTAGVAGESFTPSRSILASTVQLCLPTDVAISGHGANRQVFVVDGGNTKIWRVNRLGYAQVVLPPCDVLVPRCLVSVRRAPKAFDDTEQLSARLLDSAERDDDDEAVLYVSDPLNNLVASLRISLKPGVLSFDSAQLEAMKTNPIEGVNGQRQLLPEVWESSWDANMSPDRPSRGYDADALMADLMIPHGTSLNASTRGYDSDAPSRQARYP